MNTTRRNAIKQCFIITVGTALVPACMQDKTKPSIVLKNVNLQGKEEELLAEISETIIPPTATPGAINALVPIFILRVVDDLYTPEEQQQFVKGMKAFDKFARDKLEISFIAAGLPQREELLTGILDSNGKDIPENIKSFLKTMKKLTVQGYMSSKHYLTKVRVYELVPGRFHGCIPVATSIRK
ncbi:gluconate 2-dehydrogenase subunit 3 family protein [Flavitalea sp.]|nr:gluconate 2-dehydrogenase subunit 3 family protein [Flavitalea sp.]